MIKIHFWTLKVPEYFYLCFFGLFLFLASAQYAQAQSKTVTGVLSDKDGPLPGANVLVKGTTNGVITENDGKYKIVVPNDNVTLVFSYIGLSPVEIPLNGQSTLNATLAEGAEALDEVVVTALGIKRERKALGYAISSIKSDELVKAGTPINPLTSLYGKAAGVRVGATAGGAGAGMILNIRNSVALNEKSNTRPLVVVDGIPIFDENTSMSGNDRTGRDRGTGINDINANDIESMDILKGAKAAVLYGSAGANGVILITTKSGSKKKGFGIEGSLSYTWETLALVPDLQNEFGTGQSVALSGAKPEDVDKDGFFYATNNGQRVKTYQNGASASFGPRMDGSQILWWNGEMMPYTPQPNNYKDLFQLGHLKTANVVLSNAGDIGSFRASYTAKQYDGIQIGSNQDNHAFSFNANVKISERVKLTTVSNYYYQLSHNAPFHIQGGFVTYGVQRDMKSELFLNNITDAEGYWYFRDRKLANNIGQMAELTNNYLFGQTQDSNDEARHHFIQSANLDVKIFDWLHFNLLTGFDMTRKALEYKQKVRRPLAEDPFQGMYYVSERNLINFYSQYHLNFDFKLSDKFRLTGLVGGVYGNNSERNINTTTEHFVVENWFTESNSSKAVPTKGNTSRGKDLLYSVLGTAQLAYKNELFLEITGRNDWSSILPASNNNYFYPGASVSWIASETFKMPEVIKFAKTRVSWADVGRPGPRYFGNMAYSIGTYGGIPYASSDGELPPVDFVNAKGKMPKESLKPERKREIEFGLEMNFFTNNRLGFDFSFYRNNIYNQIIALGVPQSSGAKSVKVNAGDVQNIGFELQLRGKPVYTTNFEWEAILNLSKDKMKVKQLDKGIKILPLWGGTGAKIQATVGGEYGEIYVNPYQVNESGQRIVTSGVYLQDATNPKKVGKVMPDFMGGLANNFKYKNFSFGFNLDFQFGGNIISQTNMFLRGNGTGSNSLQYRDEARGGLPYYVDKNGKFNQLSSHTAPVPADSKYDFIFHDGVVLPGVMTKDKDGNTIPETANTWLIPAQDYYQRMFWKGDMAVSEDIIYKSDYIALRQVFLSYHIPNKISKKIGFSNTQISAFANNLAYLYKDLPNASPEITMGTNNFSEQAAASLVRVFGVELKFSF